MSFVWCKEYSPPPSPPPPSPAPPHSPPANWCNNDPDGGNGCPVGTTCGGSPKWNPTSQTKGDWKVRYMPKAKDGKCCDKATKKVKKGAVKKSNTGGLEFCKTTSGRRLLDANAALSLTPSTDAAPKLLPDPAVCCHGTGNFSMIKLNDGACCDTRTLTVRHGGVCMSSRWCKGEASDSCQEAVKISPSRKCSEAKLGHPSHSAHQHMKWREAHLGAAEAEEAGEQDLDANAAQTLLKYSNNFNGGCSHCSADNRCGPENGGTVCPGNSVCTSEGRCEVASADDQAELSDVAHPMFSFSNNYGLQCITPGCARAGLCGPSHDNKVCPSGQTCMPSGHCKDSTAAALLGAGDSATALLSAFSDNHLGACPPRMCALDQRCGPENFQVCMSGQMCVRGRCMMSYVFEVKRFLPDDVFPDYSDNNRGVCARCAGGHRQVCGGPKRLVCPGEMVCAAVHNPKFGNATANFSGTGYEDGDCNDAGVCKGDEDNTIDPDERDTDSAGRQRTTFTTGSEGATFNEFAKMAGPRNPRATYGKPICLHAYEVDEMGIQEEDIVEFDEADQAECVRPELISLPVARNRTVDTKTWAEVVMEEGNADAKNKSLGVGVRKYLVMCATAKPGRSVEGAPCGRHGEFVERVCPSWATCLSATAAVTAISAAGEDTDAFFSGYNPRPTHVCVAKPVVKAVETQIVGQDYYAFPNNDEDLDLDERVCAPDALVSRAYVLMEAAHEDTGPVDTRVPGDSATFIHLQEPCGPHHGGLVCSDVDMVCTAREGICISSALAAAAQYTVLDEYSRNFAGFADEDTASSIKDQRIAALATVPNAGLNVDDVMFRDFPMYEMKLSVPEIMLLGGQIKVVGVSLTAYGALVSDPALDDYEADRDAAGLGATEVGDEVTDPAELKNATKEYDGVEDDEKEEDEDTTIAGHKVPLKDLHWDGEIMGTLSMKDAEEGALPRVEGSFSVAVAWTMPPNGSFALRPLVARGEVRANFGGNPHAPTVIIRARAAFPIPCDFGYAFRASGSLVMRKLGGSVSGALQMSATYFCGHRPDNKLAEFDARLDEPIELAGLLRVTRMTVMGTVFRKPDKEIAEDRNAAAAVGAASTTGEGPYAEDDVSDAKEKANLKP